MSSVPLAEQAPRESVFARLWAFVKRHVLTVYAWLAFVYLMLPIAIVIAFSFNDPAGRFNYVWSGFTLDNWKNWDGVPGLASAMYLSLEIAALAKNGKQAVELHAARLHELRSTSSSRATTSSTWTRETPSSSNSGSSPSCSGREG